jgi:2,5-diketo-D-gluconate reductase A
VNQVELHVFLQQPELLKYCEVEGIAVEAYSPLAHGYGLTNPVLAKLAKKHSKSTAQIMLRWCVEVGAIPLPKSTTASRIAENIDIFDFTLDVSDLIALRGLYANHRTSWDPTPIP